MPKRERNEGSTHFEECWRVHHDCAIAAIEELLRERNAEICKHCGVNKRPAETTPAF